MSWDIRRDMVVAICCSYWFRSRVNSFLWRFHHTLVIPSSDVVQSRVTHTSAPRLVQVCYLFTSLQGCGGWEKRWKLVNRCLSTAPRCDRPLSPSPPRSLARVCSLPSGGAEGYRSRLKFSMICSVTCSVIVDTRYRPNLRLDLRLTQVVQIHRTSCPRSMFSSGFRSFL